MTSRVKEAIYFVFNNKLPLINSNAMPSQIQKWKSNPSVKDCYDKLYRKITPGKSCTYMSKIIDKVWKEKKNAAKIKIAYAMSISETFLNPDNQYIQMSEKLTKSKIVKNLVSFKIIMLNI